MFVRLSLSLSFFVCLLASAGNAGVIFSTSYTAAEGFANAPLANNPNWTGGLNVAVRPGTTGFVRNGEIASTLPTYNIHGALSGTPGSSFRIGDQISINTYIQFDLPGPGFAQEIARFGFSGTAGSNALEQGFGVVWDDGPFVSRLNSGYVRFFPDFKDYRFTNDFEDENLNNALTITGRAAGLDVHNTQGAGVDVRSNMFDVTYTAEKTGLDAWSVVEFSILNLSRPFAARESYDFGSRFPQAFTFSGLDAFFGQQLVVRGMNSQNGIARSEYVTYSFTPANPVPEPSSMIVALIMSVCGCSLRRRTTVN